MDRSNGNDEPTRAEGGSPRRSTRNAQSNGSVASTPSLPGRHHAPPRDGLAPATASAADRPSCASGLPANRQVPPYCAQSPTSAARGEGTAGDDLIVQPGGVPLSDNDHGYPLRRVLEAEGAAGGQTEARANDTALATPNDREATELAPMSSASSTFSSSSTSRHRIIGRIPTVSDSTADATVLGELENAPPLPPPSEVPTCRDECSVRERRKLMLTRQEVGWWDVVTRWWRRQVSVTVPAGGMRDHLALERTFLGYLRTSIALSITGIMIAQLMRLQHAPNPDPHYGYHALGKPLAAVFIIAAIAMVILGAFRFWRQQNAIVRGKVFAGGWEILTIMIGSTILTTTVFGLLLAVDIKKELEGRG